MRRADTVMARQPSEVQGPRNDADAVNACPVCRGTTLTVDIPTVRDYVTGESFAVRRCVSCGTRSTDPVPRSLDRFYPERYRAYRTLVIRVLRLLHKWRAASWIRRLGTSGDALEIGCGSGWMLRALRDNGWRVVGTERSVESARFAAEENGVPIFVGGLDALGPDARFDVIILFHVLEHLRHPGETLRRCATLLKPGGSVVVAVPNLDSWQARASGAAWFHLDVPRHLQHFTPQAMSRAFAEADLRATRTSFVAPELDVYGWLQSGLNRLGFPQNMLTRSLAGMDRTSSPFLLMTMIIASVPMLVLGLALSLASWPARAGAVMEIWGARR